MKIAAKAIGWLVLFLGVAIGCRNPEMEAEMRFPPMKDPRQFAGCRTEGSGIIQRTLCVEKNADLSPEQLHLVARVFQQRYKDIPVRWSYLSVRRFGDELFVSIYDDAYNICAYESGKTFEDAFGHLAKSDWDACSREIQQKPDKQPPAPPSNLKLITA